MDEQRYWIGENAARIEGVAKVTGSARFAGDEPGNAPLYAVLVPATIARGRVTAVDPGDAFKLGSVVQIFTHRNAPRTGPAEHLRLLQDDRVHHRGQPVAMVVAKSRLDADEAATRLRISYDAAEPPLVGEGALGGPSHPAPPLTRDKADSLRGDPEAAYAAAAVKVEACYSTPTHNHNAMEPHSALIEWSGDRVTVHTTTQTLFMARAAIAKAAGVPETNVQVICPYLGGGFGSKGRSWWPVLTLLAVTARMLGRPLKLTLTRAEMFALVGRRQATRHDIRLAADGDGRLQSIIHQCTAQTARFADYTDPNAALTRVLYACPNVATSHKLVATDEPMPTPMRAPGEGPGSFALESAMDELAHALGMDPLELRLRNHADRDQHRDLPWSSNSLRDCYLAGAKSFGWQTRPLAPRSMRRDGLVIGWGMATAFYPTYWAPASASLEIDGDGTLLVGSGTQDIGTGTATIMAQIASDRLGWPRNRVRPLWGDTALPPGPPSVGSMASASIAPAVVEAAGKLLAVLTARGLVSATPEAVADAVRVAPPGTFRVLSDRTSMPPGEDSSAAAWGAVFAEVAVDEALGKMRVTRLHGAYAAGRLLNRRTALAQYQGGLIFGLGMACFEESQADPRDGGIVNANLAEYLVPVMADIPEMAVTMIDEDDPVEARFGVKGIGMVGTVGTAAAIANALFHASGRRVRDLPIRIDRIL